jgi:transcriptional regulator with XRE-family HTH domain
MVKDNRLKIIAENLRGFREKRGFSQEKLAFHAQITSEYVSKIERTITNPSVGILFQICDALHIDPCQLFIPNAYKKKIMTERGKE